MKVSVVNLDNEKVGDLELNPEVFGVVKCPDLVKRCIVYQLSKAQQGTHKVKACAEVSGTGRKPFKQKGTGNARLGSKRAPQCRGGAVIFGPVVRSHAIKIPKKMWKLGICSVLSEKLSKQKLIVLDECIFAEISTKLLADKLKNFDLGSAVFVDVDFEKNFALSIRNIPNMLPLKAIGLNVYDLLKYNYIIISTKAVQSLEQRLVK